MAVVSGRGIERWVAFVIGLGTGVVTGSLVVATLWRAAQFGVWLEVGVPGVLGLVVGQLALLLFPSIYGYLSVATDDLGADYSVTLLAMVVVNGVAGIASAAIQFHGASNVPAAVVHGMLPGSTALAVALVVWLCARRAAYPSRKWRV